MATREELEEKYDDCQETPDYVAVAVQIFQDLQDKEWAEEIYDEGADWAATAADFLALSNGARVIHGDDEKAAELFEQAKSSCTNANEMIDLAVAAAENDQADSAKEMFSAAAEKATKASEFLNLAQKVSDSLGDKELALEMGAKGKEKCKTPADFAELAEALMNDFNDADQAKDVLVQAVDACTKGDDYAALAVSGKKLFPDTGLDREIYSKAEASVESGLELGNLAAKAVSDLEDSPYATELFNKASGMLEQGNDLMKLAGVAKSALNDNDLVLQILSRAGEKYESYAENMKLGDAILKDTGDKEAAGKVFIKAAGFDYETPKLVKTAEKLADEVGDVDAAMAVLKDAENAVKTNSEFQTMADAVLKYGTEKQWLDDISLQKEKRAEFSDLYDDFIKREQEAETGVSLRILGHDVSQATGDHPYVRKLYVNAEKQARYLDDYMNLAEVVAQDLGDMEWAGKLYGDLFESADDFLKKSNVVTGLMKNTDARDQVETFVKKMEEEVESAPDHMKLAGLVHQLFGDEEWTRSLFKNAEENSKDRAYLLSLAGQISSTLGDQSWASELYEKALAACGDRFQCEQVFQVIENQGGGDAVKALYKKAEDKFSSTKDFIYLAESAFRRFGDKEWAKSLYKKALEAGEGVDTKFDCAASIVNTLGDHEWAGSVRSK